MSLQKRDMVMKKYNFKKTLLMLTDVLLIGVSALVSNAILALVCVWLKIPHDTYIVNDIRLWWIIALNVMFSFFMLFIAGAYNKLWRDLDRKSVV